MTLRGRSKRDGTPQSEASWLAICKYRLICRRESAPGLSNNAQHEFVSPHPSSQDDLFAAWSYIAQDNVEAADRVEAQIYTACGFLSSLHKLDMSDKT
jgi:hypothetical protein